MKTMTDEQYHLELERAREARLRAETEELARKDREEEARRKRAEEIKGWADRPPALIENHLRQLRALGLSIEEIDQLRLEVHEEVPLATTEISRGGYVLRKAEALVVEKRKTAEEQAVERSHRGLAYERMKNDGADLPPPPPGTVGTIVRAKLTQTREVVVNAAMAIEEAKDKAKEARKVAVESLTKNARDELSDANLAVELATERYGQVRDQFLELRANVTSPEALENFERMNEILAELSYETLSGEFIEPAFAECIEAAQALGEAIGRAQGAIRGKAELQKELYVLDVRTGLREAHKVIQAELSGSVESFLRMMLTSRLRSSLSGPTKELLFTGRPETVPLEPLIAYRL